MNFDFYDINMPNELIPYDLLDNNQKTVDLFPTYEGYLKGNAFRNEYVPYKDYKVMKINVKNEKEELLLNIGQYSFIMHDLNLYLDTHPDNKDALDMFVSYHNKVNDLITQYERRYGPLCVKGFIDNNIPFSWVNTKWPWVN